MYTNITQLQSDSDIIID